MTPFRRTHRVELYYAGCAQPVLYDVRVDGRHAYPRDEPAVPLLELRDGLWHYVRGEPITRGPDVQGLPGRRPAAEPRRSITVGDHHVKLTEAEIAAYTAAAGDTPLATWLREQSERFSRRRRETISAWMRRAAAEGRRRGSK